MPVGDSITLGEGGVSGYGGYRGLLYNLLINAGYNVDYLGTATDNSNAIPDRNHEGHGGWRIDQIHSNIAGWLGAVGYPDIILLHIGTNDFIQGYDSLNAIHRLDALVTRIAELRPNTHIIVSSLIPLFEPESTGPQIFFNQFVPGIVEAHIAAGRLVSYIDMHSVVSFSEMPDRIHPNQGGYNKMAGAWLQAIEAVVEPPNSVPPAIVDAAGTAARNEVVITFNKRLDETAAQTLSNYSIDQDLSIHSARLSNYGRTITLGTAPQTLGTTYTLTVNGLVDKVEPTPNPIAVDSTVTFFPPTPSGCFNNVAEAGCYTLVLSLDIPDAADFSSGVVPYTRDLRNRIGTFDRIAYYLELKAPGGDLHYAWASMDAFTTDLSLVGIPTGATFQQSVDHLNVASNVPGVTSGEDRQGNLEFWPYDYSASNSHAVPGASDSVLDSGDTDIGAGNYGSMQIHDTSGSRTIIAFNRWGGIGGEADLGIGNRPTGDPDWTLAQNAADYEVRSLQVLVRTTGDATPPSLASAQSEFSETDIIVRFSEPVRMDTLIAANFSLDQGVSVLGLSVSDDGYEIVLHTTTHPPSPMTLTVSQVRDCSQNANEIVPGSTIAVSPPTLPDEVVANIGAAAEGYKLVYTLEIPSTGNLNAENPYLIDNSAVGGGFTRIAYYMELEQPGTTPEYVWTAMDKFSSIKNKIGVPTFASGASFRQAVANLDVISNAPGVVTGSWPTGGNIEFWPNDYGAANTGNVPGAESNKKDFGDDRLTTGNYGSMQVHNSAELQTLFALNGWGADGRMLDLGIGNRPVSDPDWTSARNAGTYSRRLLHIMVLPEPPAPVPAEVLAKVPESADYELVYSLDIPARGNLSGGSGFVPYSIDRSGESGPFSRVAYYIELQKSSDAEPTFAWVSLDAFTTDRSKIGVPNSKSGAVFRQLATNLNIVSNSGITTGTGLTGNLEFWPSGYEVRNALPVPGASSSIYDFGDNPASGDYGSMQIHNYSARETIFAINHWGTTGSTSNPLCVGIGSNPTPINGATDYTFADNAPTFDQTRKLHVFVLPGPPATDSPQFVDAYASVAGDKILLTFDRELTDGSAHPSHFTIDGGLAVTSATLLPGNREIALHTSPQSAGTLYTVRANGGIFASGSTDAEMPIGATIQVTAYTTPAVLAEVPDSGYDLIYELDLPADTPRWNINAIPYSVDETRFGERLFDRVGYLMQLDEDWVYVSFDAHTDMLSKIGVPTKIVTSTPFQRIVKNMNVASNVTGIVTGSGLTTGNIEFWSGDYDTFNRTSIPNANNSSYDFGDRMLPGSYGTMQVHNHGTSQTLLAYNDWGSRSGGISDMGIGTNTGSGSTDWSLADNANAWTTRKLYVFAHAGGTATGAAPEIVSNPCDRLVPAGSPVTFSVSVLGDGPFAFQWRRNGVELPGQTHSWLGLSSIAASDAGEYDVVVTAPNLASATSRAASLTVDDPAPLPYELWRTRYGLSPSDGDLDDPDHDELPNLIEFALGTDPTLSDNRPLAIDGTVNGTPTIAAGPNHTFDAIFPRRSDHGQSGSLSYTVQFSSDLKTFSTSTALPSFVSDSLDDPSYELVKVPFPILPPNARKALFFRVQVDLIP